MRKAKTQSLLFIPALLPIGRLTGGVMSIGETIGQEPSVSQGWLVAEASRISSAQNSSFSRQLRCGTGGHATHFYELMTDLP